MYGVSSSGREKGCCLLNYFPCPMLWIENYFFSFVDIWASFIEVKCFWLLLVVLFAQAVFLFQHFICRQSEAAVPPSDLGRIRYFNHRVSLQLLPPLHVSLLQGSEDLLGNGWRLKWIWGLNSYCDLWSLVNQSLASEGKNSLAFFFFPSCDSCTGACQLEVPHFFLNKCCLLIM